jgi:hypothetical protein
MSWVISRIVFLLITIWMLRGTTFASYTGRHKEDEFNMTLWVLLIMYLLFLIPYCGVLFFIAWVVWFCIWSFAKPHGSYNKYVLITLSEKNRLHKVFRAIYNFVTKQIK